jgi:RND superfamily putative drug exporter
MFIKLGKFAYRSRWFILVFWLILVGAGLVFTLRLSSVLKAGGFDAPNAEYFIAQETLNRKLGGFHSEVVVLFAVPDGITATDPTFSKQLDEAVAAVRDYRDTQAVLTYFNTQDSSFVSFDGKHAIAIIGLKSDEDTTQENLEEIKSLVKPGSLKIEFTGGPVYNETITKVSEEDALRGELLAFPAALLVLLVVFRTLVAAFLPLLMAGSAILVALGSLFFIGQGVDLSVFVLNISTLLGLGLSIDYSLLIISRFREELYLSDYNVELAVECTLNSAGRAVFFSGLTVVIGLASLLIFDLMVMRSIGVGGMMVVFVGMLASLSLLPAILCILGRRINSLKLPFIRSVDEVMLSQRPTLWYRISQGVMKHPVPVLLITIAFLLLLGSPILHLRFGTSSYEILPADNPTRKATEIVVKEFPGSAKTSDYIILVEARNGKMTDPETVAALFDYTRKLAEKPGVKSVQSPVNLPLPQPLSKEGYQQLLQGYATNPAALDPRLAAAIGTQLNDNIVRIKLDTGLNYISDEAATLVKDLRNNQPGGFSVKVTGEPARLQDFVQAVYGRFPVSIALVVVFSYLTLLLMFRSAVLPLKAVFMTGVSLTASYGALVWIFQDGNLSEFLGFTPQGYVESVLPILLFAILFGLSMDYEVFLLTRVSEYYEKTRNNTLSVALGVGRTAGIITSAALILIMVASGFTFAAIVAVKAIGLGIAIAVAVDATIVRGLLVPATMKLLGDWNWWIPAPLARLLPKIKVD